MFAILLAIIGFICAKRRNNNKEISETQSSTDCSEVGRPFMHQNYQQHPQTLGIKNNNLMINKPLPPTPMTLGQWNNAIHPKQSMLYGPDSGFNDQDTTKDMFEAGVNQYEVPYAHLLRPYRAPEEIYFTQEAFLNPQSINVPRNYSRNTNTSAGASGGSHTRYYKEYETQ